MLPPEEGLLFQVQCYPFWTYLAFVCKTETGECCTRNQRLWEALLLSSENVTFWHWIFLFSRNKACDVNIDIIANVVCSWKTRMVILQIMTRPVPLLDLNQLPHMHPVWPMYPQQLRFDLCFCLSLVLVDLASIANLQIRPNRDSQDTLVNLLIKQN